ncbi:HNH endonuclease [Candidatus Bathyarchaeota archaeon]|nr:HNH endonuclease [Candidatus Bathyarchaeota archaeon]
MAERIIYARKLYDQELGYRKEEPRKAGRYIFISKRAIPYFPPLSTNIRNDYLFVNLIPPTSDRIVLTKYVYHNDRIVDQKPYGRDEFRLYLNSENDPNGDYFKPDDIVLIDKYTVKDEFVYRIYHFPVEEKSTEYKMIEQLIMKGQIKGGRHALIETAKLPFLELQKTYPFGDKVIPPEIIEDELGQPVEDELKSLKPLILPQEIMKQEFRFTNIIRERAFRDLLLYFYEYRCAIKGTGMKYKNLINLEAAHIIPGLYGGPAHPKNGIPMSRDLHWAFDLGFFTISKNYSVIIHDDVSEIPEMKAIDGSGILLPQDKRAWPSQFSLEWHQKNIFGIFSIK